MSAEHRVSDAAHREKRLSALLQSVGARAAEKARLLNQQAVPSDHESRTLAVTAEEMQEARDLGFEAICGIRLVAQ